MFTLDANIFARDFDPRDPDYTICHTLLDRLGQTGMAHAKSVIGT